MGVDLEKEILKLLECSKCKQNFSDPTFTVCNHLFCKSCIREVLFSDKKQCPVCKTVISRQTNRKYDRIYRTCHIAENLRQSATFDKDMEENILIEDNTDAPKTKITEAFVEHFLNVHSDVLLDIANVSKVPEVKSPTPDDSEHLLHFSVSQCESPHKKYIDILPTPIKNKFDGNQTHTDRIHKVKNWLTKSQNIFNEISNSEKKYANESVIRETLNIPSVSQLKYVAPPRHSSSEDETSKIVLDTEDSDEEFIDERSKNKKANERDREEVFKLPLSEIKNAEENISNIVHMDSIEMCVEYSNIKSAPTPVLKNSLQSKKTNKTISSTQQNIYNMDEVILKTQNTQKKKDKNIMDYLERQPICADKHITPNNTLLNKSLCRFLKLASIVDNAKKKHIPFYKLGKCSMNSVPFENKSCQTDFENVCLYCRSSIGSKPILQTNNLRQQITDEEPFCPFEDKSCQTDFENVLSNVVSKSILQTNNLRQHITDEEPFCTEENDTIISNNIRTKNICLKLTNDENFFNICDDNESSNSFTPLRDIGTSSEIGNILNKNKNQPKTKSNQVNTAEPKKSLKRIRKVSTSSSDSDSSINGRRPSNKKPRRTVYKQNLSDLSLLLSQSLEKITSSDNSEAIITAIASEDSELMNYNEILSDVFAQIDADIRMGAEMSSESITPNKETNVQTVDRDRLYNILNADVSEPIEHTSEITEITKDVGSNYCKKNSEPANVANINKTTYTDDMEVEEIFLSAASNYDPKNTNSQKRSDTNCKNGKKKNQLSKKNIEEKNYSLSQSDQTIDKMMLGIEAEMFGKSLRPVNDDENETITNNTPINGESSKNSLKVSNKNQNEESRSQLDHDSEEIDIVERTPPTVLVQPRSSMQTRNLRSRISLNFNEEIDRSFKKRKSIEPLEKTPVKAPNLIDKLPDDGEILEMNDNIDTPSCISKFVRNVTNRSTPVCLPKLSRPSVDAINIPETEYVNSQPESQNTSLTKNAIKNKSIILTTSSLDKCDNAIVNKFVTKFNGNYSSQFLNSTTHIVFKVNSDNCAARTVKFLRGLAKGIWLINMNWIKSCLEKDTLLDEEPFEVLDVSGEPGPERCRKMNRNVYLNWLSIAFVEAFTHIGQDVLQEVVQGFGGNCVSKFNDTSRCNLIILDYNNCPDEDKHKMWATKLEASLVDISWLLEIVCRGELVPICTYLLCDIPTTHSIENDPKCPPEVLLQETQWSENS